MQLKKISHVALCGVTLFCLGLSESFAADSDSTLRQLATARGRYIGSILNTEWFNNSLGSDASSYETIHKSQFNIVVAENEMKFDATEPSRGVFNFTKAEKLMSYAAENNMQVRGHALAWHSQVPSWVSTLASNVQAANGSPRDTLLAVLKLHIDSVVGHFKGKIHEWDVVNEAIDDNTPHNWRSTNSVWYQYIGRDFIDSAFVWAHKADTSAKLYYNDYSLEWGLGSGSKAQFAVDSIAERLTKAGIYITGIGTQTHIQNTHTSTPANVRSLATKLKALGLTLQITELDIGFQSGTTPSSSDYEAQGHLYRQFMDVFLESANMEDFVIWGFTDKYSWLSQQGKFDGLIFNSSFAKKPAYDSLIASLKAHDASIVTPAGSVNPIEWINSTPKFGNETYVIVDYTIDSERGSWTSDVKAGNPTFVSSTFDGISAYMNIPLAGCDQSTCDYQHAIYTLPDEAVSYNVLSRCENLIITMHGIDSLNYVNVGVNSPWINLEYGRPANISGWSETTVDLQAVRDSSATPTQLTFNSNGSGIYLTKITAVGCPDDLLSIPSSKKIIGKAININVSNRILSIIGGSNYDVQIFDLQGRPLIQAKNVNSEMHLNTLPNGLYIVRVNDGSQNLIRQIFIK